MVLAWLALSPLDAGPVEDSIVRQLRAQGFGDIAVNRTLLGRSRIVAQSSTLYREIVVNPATGEILRDFWRPLNGEGGSVSILDPDALSQSLTAPEEWRLVAYLCVGWPKRDHATPELERAGRETRAADLKVERR